MRKSFWQGVVTAFGMVGVGAATWLFWRHNARPLAQDDAAFGPAFGSTTDNVVAGYSLWLEVRFHAHFIAFKVRLKSEREAAEAEALVFAMLRCMNLRPEPSEDVSTGGVDFRCEPKGKDRFFVEVTSIPRETVTQRSGLPHDGEHIGGFSMLTSVLRAKATRKAAQMGNLDGARMLAVVANHRNADTHEHLPGQLELQRDALRLFARRTALHDAHRQKHDDHRRNGRPCDRDPPAGLAPLTAAGVRGEVRRAETAVRRRW